ncbi:hypothetical protein V2G26_007004 [Clonostachys chloroleuca]
MTTTTGDELAAEYGVQEPSRIDNAHPALLFAQGSGSPSGDAALTAQLSGTFLQRHAIATGPPPRQIICYRRNIFQVRGTIDLKGSLSHGDARPAVVRVTLSAVENTKGDEVAIVVVPKTAASKSSGGPGSPAPIEIAHKSRDGRGYGGLIPFCWPRLQFRSATTKGGRRKAKGPEQYFIIHIRLTADFPDGSSVLLSDNMSAPIIVRGRSPCNFPATQNSSPGNQQLITETSHEARESTESQPLPASVANPPRDGSHNAYLLEGEFPNYDDEFLFDISALDFPINSELGAHFLEDEFRSGDGSFTLSPYLNFGDANFPSIGPPAALHPGLPTSAIQSPSSLSVASSRHDAAANFQNSASLVQQATENKDSEPLASEEAFTYKYIPLGADDRTPPVQGVYQPHAVHHKLHIPKTMQGNNKRYFGELAD